MINAESDPRLYRIFRELQEKGLIDRKTRLVRCPLTVSIRGSPALNCIRYRYSFYERYLSGASDDALRFMLLHEEGHVRKGSSLLSALLALPLLPCLAFFGHPPLLAGALPLAKLVFAALILLTVLFAYRTYYRRMDDEEFTADRYAADAMRNCYRTRDPGALLQNLLFGLRRGPSLRSESDYRPSISERVQRLRAASDHTERRPILHSTERELLR